MNRNLALLAGVAAGTAAGLLLRRRRAPQAAYPPPPVEPDPRAEELKRKLDEAREQAADADDFEAAGMGAETMVEEEPRQAPAAGEVDEARRRVHEEARAAAEEMRREGETT